MGRIEEIVKVESGRLGELESDSRLVHGDFNPTNVLINKRVVSGVLDWEYGHSGTPYMDIVNLLRNTLPDYHRQIKAGLESGRMSLLHDWMEEAELVHAGGIACAQGRRDGDEGERRHDEEVRIVDIRINAL